MHYYINSCLEFVVHPARVLEIVAFDTVKSRTISENCCLRHIARRLVALVAPVFYFYEFLLSCLTVTYDLANSCGSGKSLRELLFNEDKGTIIRALNSLCDAGSSLCEIPQKILCASNVNYFGTAQRNYSEPSDY